MTHLGIQLPYLSSGQLQEKVFTLILKKIMPGKCYAYRWMYTKLIERRVLVTCSLKSNDFFCHVTAGKYSLRVGIPPFQLHLESTLDR